MRPHHSSNASQCCFVVSDSACNLGLIHRDSNLKRLVDNDPWLPELFQIAEVCGVQCSVHYLLILCVDHARLALKRLDEFLITTVSQQLEHLNKQSFALVHISAPASVTCSKNQVCGHLFQCSQPWCNIKIVVEAQTVCKGLHPLFFEYFLALLEVWKTEDIGLSNVNTMLSYQFNFSGYRATHKEATNIEQNSCTLSPTFHSWCPGRLLIMPRKQKLLVLMNIVMFNFFQLEPCLLCQLTTLWNVVWSGSRHNICSWTWEQAPGGTIPLSLSTASLESDWRLLAWILLSQ